MKATDKAAEAILATKSGMMWWARQTALHHLEDLCTVEILPTGIHFTPSVISAHELLRELTGSNLIVFTRELNHDLTYKWVSCQAGVRLVIEANEFIGHAGEAISVE